MHVTSAGSGRAPLAPALVRQVVRAVLDGERAGDGAVSVTFLGPSRMRALNRRTFGRGSLTDVIAFPLAHPAGVAGDVYVCAAAARQAANSLGIKPREELIRLLVHGTLHLLGRNHPDGAGRLRSAMWRRQERYVRALLRRP